MQIVKNEGFNVLQIKYDKHSSVIRHLYMKRFVLNTAAMQRKNSDNEIQQQECKSENRTLFILNIPPFINEHHIRYLFQNCGQIVQIYFEKKPSFSTATLMHEKLQKLDSKMKQRKQKDETAPSPSVAEFFTKGNEIVAYKICYVVFGKLSGLSNALDMAKTDQVYTFVPDEIDSNDSRWLTGIKLWQSQYNNSIIEQYRLVKIAENFVSECEKNSDEQNEQRQIEAELQQSNEQQSGGWITVNRKLRRDRRALIADQHHDRQIEEKYKDREMKRKSISEKFDEQIAPIIEGAMKKKKKNPRTIYNSF
ncbi:rRNA processing protein RRP7-like protein [Euroglyphus maynei]|uniref:rRNA processing protein RRP7-like protein n=1 Tax=Euroglyphus maynei TaxID=6958 RepID=A0A1Y3BPI5_EURMA|nr:rRNA processing protein RRP7-like protein [Euroglyphus maynei]